MKGVNKRVYVLNFVLCYNRTMLKIFTLIFECSRIYSLPMTILSWLVVFVFGIYSSGNVFRGVLALLGICLAHLGTNVLDDLFDYRHLIRQVDFDKNEYLKNTQKTKCRYLISGMLTERDVLLLAAAYFALAGFIGLYFIIVCGKAVLYFMLAGALIGILYSFMSRFRLSEVAVSIAYGPALFGGVYYVMTGVVSGDVFLLSIPTMIVTTVLLYIHTVMDYDYDLSEGKKTISNSFDSQLSSLVVLKIFLILAYISLVLLPIFDILDWQVFLVWLTIPLACDLYNSMVDFSTDSDSVPQRKWFHFPMENMKQIRKIGAESFMVRIYQSRNLMIYFSLFLVLAIILCNL